MVCCVPIADAFAMHCSAQPARKSLENNPMHFAIIRGVRLVDGLCWIGHIPAHSARTALRHILPTRLSSDPCSGSTS